MLYSNGVITKADGIALFKQGLALHRRKLKALRAGRGEPGDSIEDREREIEKFRDALDEMKGLPDDPDAGSTGVAPKD